MSNRLNLGGWYVSQGEQSLGDLRARYFVEYSNALQQKISEIWMNNQDKYDNPREVLADIIAGDLDEELAKDNEVHPEEYDKEEYLADLEGAESGTEKAEADD